MYVPNFLNVSAVDLIVDQLGNYLGALANWVELQRNAGPQDQLIYSIVGYHAITMPQEPKKLERERMDIMASILAIGIDPEKSILFHQDQVIPFVANTSNTGG